jgi:hypothetical protein
LLRIEQPTIGGERILCLSDGKLWADHVRSHDTPNLSCLCLRPHGTEQASGGPDDCDRLAPKCAAVSRGRAFPDATAAPA